jgi:putative endonuclease
MAHHNELGKLGEDVAVDFLVRNGYVLLERNFVHQKAEIDIIAEKDNTIIIVEVKTRNSAFFGDPQSFVSKGKIKLLVKAANEYIISNSIEREVRFDIIAILKNRSVEKIEHFKNAFYHF